MITRSVTRVLLACLVAVGIVIALPAQQAHAAVGSDFNPGNIISDAAFYDGSAMNTTQVQGFLNQQVPKCDAGWVCLKDYKQNTPHMPADAYCKGYTGATNESAAAIIAKVGQTCNISQRVLLVLLQKEQSLVTHTWPSSWRFDKATGFACPDTAPCDASFGGFFYQVYYAARQFQRYAAEPHRYNYQAGRVNNILYNPNAACGSSPVFIANKATAGLYNYTPYQPNQAALNNLYGTGDSCSSYGNRNFWRLYADWFGSPAAGSSLVRTVDNATVYLISGETKYPVPSLGVLTALSPLGQVAFVSDAYLSNFTTGPLAGGVYRDENGSIFLLDNGYKVSFRTCGQVADFGYACDAATYIQLTNAQAAAFTQGPILSNLVGTTSGARFYVTAGERREILDEASQAAENITGSMTVLTDSAVSRLPFGAPIARDEVIVASRAGGYAVFSNGNRYTVSAATASAIGLGPKASGTLDAQSIAKRGTNLGELPSVVRDANGVLTLLSARGKWTLPTAPESVVAPTAPQWLLASYSTLGTIGEGAFLIGPGGGTVYIVMADTLRPIASWGALEALSMGQPISITTVDQAVIDAMPKGPVALTAGTLVRSPQNATVFLINGTSTRIPFASFVFPNEAGFTTFSYASQDRLDAYALEPQVMGFGFQCESVKYIAGGGQLHKVPAELEAMYPFNYIALDKFTCATLKKGSDATRFVRTPEGTIWHLSPDGRRYVTSMSRLAELGGSEGYVNVHPWFVSPIPNLGAA